MMTKERPWIFSIHALSRAASRFNLIVDEKARLEIFKQLNHEPTVVTRHHDRVLFEISLFGRKVIAVCEPHKRAIVTLLDAKKWYRNRATQSRRGKNIPPRPGWNDSEEE
jgi:hypothetical protein